MLQNAGVLYILTYKCAWRHSGVRFLDIWPSKSGPRVWSFCTFWLANVLGATAASNFFRIGTSNIGPSLRCLAHFDLKMRFAPQGRAIFEHRNFKKLLRPCGVLCILTGKCASRHSGVRFLDIWTSKIAPRLWCFAHFDLQMCLAPQRRAIFHLSAEQLPPHPPPLARLLFGHQEARIIEKTQRFATSLTFRERVYRAFYWLYSRVDLLSTDSTRVLIFLLLTWLLYSAFQLSILSEVRLLKLPSMTIYIYIPILVYRKILRSTV